MNIFQFFILLEVQSYIFYLQELIVPAESVGVRKGEYHKKSQQDFFRNLAEQTKKRYNKMEVRENGCSKRNEEEKEDQTVE